MKKIILLALVGFGWVSCLQAQTLINNEFLKGTKTDGSTLNLIGVNPANNVVIGSQQAVITPYGSVGFNTTNLPNYPQLRFEGGGYYFYKKNTDGSMHSYIYFNNADLNMAYKARGSGGRAVVHDGGNRLYLNYGGDFTGGTRVGPKTYFSNDDLTRSYVQTPLTVGTTVGSAGYMLSVAGKIRADEVKVYTGWADFVFKDDYVLRPLAEVEQHIRQKGHLPDIPSEAEVLENGIELGAMDAKLLQKIEELTLYAIEQQKAIEKQQAQIQLLINQNQDLLQEVQSIKSSKE